MFFYHFLESILFKIIGNLPNGITNDVLMIVIQPEFEGLMTILMSQGQKLKQNLWGNKASSKK